MLTTPAFLLKVRTLFDPDKSVISLDFRIVTPWIFLTVLPHMSWLITIHLRRHGVLLTIAYAEWSPWSSQHRSQLCYHTFQDCRCILHSTAARHKIDLSQQSHQWPLSLHSHIIIIWLRQYPRILVTFCECGYAWFLKLPHPTTPFTSATFIAGAWSIKCVA